MVYYIVSQIGVMELADAGDLKKFMTGDYDPAKAKMLLIDVLHGLNYLHQKGIIHRDLKPPNILLVNDDGILCAKISDFGISKVISSEATRASSLIDTIDYMAPEQFSPDHQRLKSRQLPLTIKN